MNRKMIDGVRAALDQMAVAESMIQHELEAAQEAARNASAEAHAEGYYKDKEIKKQDKKLGNTKEAMDPTDHVKEKDGKFCVYNADGTIAKEFDNKKDADAYAIANHDAIMATAKKDDKKDEAKEAMDPVDKKALKGKHKDRKDKDIDNDGDVDGSDEYLHKRRKAISKADEGIIDKLKSMTPAARAAKKKAADDKAHADMKKKMVGFAMAKKGTAKPKTEGTVRERLMSIWEDAAGAKRTAGATEAEPMTKGDEDKKMKAGHPVAKAALSDNSDAAEKATKPAAMRGNDNKNAEKNIKPSATKDTANKVSAKESIDAIAAAYEGMKKDG